MKGNRCEANSINGCENPATLELVNRRGKGTGEWVCCEECGNELAGELSEGTWVPFPSAKNALTDEQVRENLSYFRED